MTEGATLGTASDRTEAAGTGPDGSGAGGLAFGKGWDRQDRWLRFVDPVLEHAYRDAMTVPTRRRFRTAGIVGIVVYASLTVLLPALGLGTLGFTVIVVVVMIATFIPAIVWAGRVGLAGMWGLTCAVEVVAAIITVALQVAARGGILWFLAIGLASIAIIAIAWIRVAWWVAAAMSVALVVLYVSVGLTQGGDDGVVAFQTYLLAVTLGVATVGSWFLEAAERRAFAQGLLVDHLYQRVDRLFRQYLSPDVAATLVDDPKRAELGGEVVEVSVLFADLSGYTPFSERRSPDEVVSMLNATFGAAVPTVLAEGGTIVQFVGDALMAIFNAPLRQPDHALRACRAGLALQRATPADPSAGRPRFRVGINTGPALVGNIGSAELHNFSALGDTTNVAARLQTYAEEGSVVIGERTYELVREAADVRALGPADLKGKSTPTMVFELVGLREEARLAGEAGFEPPVA